MTPTYEKIGLMIRGTPISKARPRFARAGKFVRVYNPQESEEGRFLFHVQCQLKETGFNQPLEGPISLVCGFYFGVPKSTSKKKRAEFLSGESKHTKKPDLSNLLKFVEDCLNNVIWNDDSQIIEISCAKYYAENPATVLVIEPINK